MPFKTTGPELFYAMRRHGFVRIATSAPRGRPGDVAFNTTNIIAEARKAHSESVDLLVFPELCVSSYAIDDLHLQTALLDAVEQALEDIRQASEELSPVVLVGAPLRFRGSLYNCAVALSRGRFLGIVPKSYLPNYREYYEKRWFVHGRDIKGETMSLGGEAVAFGTDLIFEASDFPALTFHIEICEDYWAAIPPSSEAALAGALILANLSASNITIGKADDRHLLSQASPCGPWQPMSIPPPDRAKARPTWPGMARVRSTNWAKCWQMRCVFPWSRNSASRTWTLNV